jgi:flagellar biosynthetic protein FlhB
VLERKPLARALFKSVDVGQEIPFDFFRAIAEILAQIYKTKQAA